MNYYGNGSEFTKDYIVGEGIDHLAFKVDDLDRGLDEARNLGRPTVWEMRSGNSSSAYI